MSASLERQIFAAIADPGATEGYKGEARSLTQWQTDAVMRVVRQHGEFVIERAVGAVQDMTAAALRDTAGDIAGNSKRAAEALRVIAESVDEGRAKTITTLQKNYRQDAGTYPLNSSSETIQ